MLRFLESLVPIFKKLFKSAVRKRMVEKLIEDLERHCPDMRTRHSRCNHMVRHTQRCREDLSLIAVVVEYLHDLLDHLHAVDPDIVKAANKRTHDVGAGLRCQQRLRCGKDERYVDSNAILRKTRAGADTIARQGTLTTTFL